MPLSTKPLGIQGAYLIERTIIEDDRGSVTKYWREDEGIGHVAEVYLSTARYLALKAWHLHDRMTLRYICVQGRALVGLVDGRHDSPTFGQSERVYLTDSYDLVAGRSSGWLSMLVIPPGVWNGYRGQVGFQGRTTIINLPDLAHDRDEIVRLHPDWIQQAQMPQVAQRALLAFDWGHYEVAG